MILQRHSWIIERLKGWETVPMPRQRTGKGYSGDFPMVWGAEPRVVQRSVGEWGAKLPALMSMHTKDPDLIGGVILISLPEDAAVKKGLLARILKEPRYVTNKLSLAKQFASKLLDLSQTLTPDTVPKMTNAELINALKAFRHLFREFEWHNSIWFIGGDSLAKHIEDKLKVILPQDAIFEAMQIVSSPIKPSFVHAQQAEITLIASMVVQKPELRKAFEENSVKVVLKILKNHPEIMSAIEKHAAKYFWIPFGHAGPEIWGKGHFVQEIKELIHDGDVAARLRHLQVYHKELAEKHRDLQKKFKIPRSLWRLCEDLQAMASIQDFRKEVVSRSHIPWQTVYLPEVEKRTGIPITILRRMPAEEIESALSGNIDKDFMKRKKDYILIVDDLGYTFYTGEEYKYFADVIKSKVLVKKDVVHGQSACLGYAKGIAKVLRSADEIDKVLPGDILIATMTTPDYILAMKKAAAIVTNEGGVTCHAAIVSREFGIPCVIGTGNATFVFKDGDMIEVDAEKGIVRKIK